MLPSRYLDSYQTMTQNVRGGKGKRVVRKLSSGSCLVRKMLLLLTASAVVILVIAQAATTQTYTQGKGSISNPTSAQTEGDSQGRERCSRPWRKNSDPSLASSFAPVALVTARQPCIHYLRRTGGLPLVTTLVLGSIVVMVGSSVVIRALMRQ